MGAIILSSRDLSDELNRTQARYELNRAIDSNDPYALADWAKNWGEAALEAADNMLPEPEQEWWEHSDDKGSLTTLTDARKEIGAMLEQATAIIALGEKIQAIGKSATDSITAEIENIEDAA